MKKILFVMVLCMSSQVSAFDYNKEKLSCIIKGAYNIGIDGKLIELQKSSGGILNSIKSLLGIKVNYGYASKAIDTPLSINRNTGIYSNIQLENEKWKVFLLDKGSAVQSLKIVSTSTGEYVWAQYLQVDLYVDTPNKPLRIIDSGNIYTGFCQ
jgi:hypothetical protein